MQLHRDSLCLARVLSEDDDWLVLEIPKNDDVKFTLRRDEEGNTVGGDQFLTLIFLRSDGDGSMTVWKPWEDDELEDTEES